MTKSPDGRTLVIRTTDSFYALVTEDDGCMKMLLF